MSFFRFNIFLKIQKIEVFPACLFSTVTQGRLPSDYNIYSVSLISSTNAKKSYRHTETQWNDKMSCFCRYIFPEICEKG